MSESESESDILGEDHESSGDDQNIDGDDDEVGNVGGRQDNQGPMRLFFVRQIKGHLSNIFFSESLH